MRPVAWIVLAWLATGAVHAGETQLSRLGHDVVPKFQAIALDLDPRQHDYTGSVDVNVEVRSGSLVSPPRRGDRPHENHADPAGEIGKDDSAPLQGLGRRQVELAAGSEIATGRYALRIDFRTTSTRRPRASTG